MRRLTISFATPAELVAAHEREMRHGGLLLRGVDPAGLALFDAVELEVVAGKPVIVPAQVVQLVGGVGVAVTFASTALAAVLEEARGLGAGAWPGAAPKPVSNQPLLSPAEKYRQASPSEKIQIALHGTRDDRGMVLRDTNRLLHPYVLKNPNVQLDEVSAMAKMASVSPELLKQISERREWISRPDIAIALVRNPNFPVPLALKVLDHVSPGDLRQLAKDSKTRPAIQQLARKKVIAP